MHRPLLLSAIFMCAVAVPSFASLGGKVDSIASDQTALRASRQMRIANNYSVHEMTLESGTIVHEYANTAGTVFAVSYSGKYKPDLHQLLGDHWQEFLQTAQQHRARGSVNLTLPSGAVVQLGGHMGSYSGVAYLPHEVPQGVTRDDLR